MYASASPHLRSGSRAFPACVLACCLGALSAPTAAAPRYFTVVNDAHDDIVGLWIAEPGSGHWQRVDTDAHGVAASGEAMFDIAVRGQDACIRDLRFEFSRGAALLQRDLNICRHARYRPGLQRRRVTRQGAG